MGCLCPAAAKRARDRVGYSCLDPGSYGTFHHMHYTRGCDRVCRIESSQEGIRDKRTWPSSNRSWGARPVAHCPIHGQLERCTVQPSYQELLHKVERGWQANKGSTLCCCSEV